MYAIIRTGSKQYRVEPGQELLVELLHAEPGSTLKIDDVLLYSDGTTVTVGTPKVSAAVHCIVLGDEKGPKLRTIKYNRRKHYQRKYGHRQGYTRLQIEKIESLAN